MKISIIFVILILVTLTLEKQNDDLIFAMEAGSTICFHSYFFTTLIQVNWYDCSLCVVVMILWQNDRGSKL